MLAISENEYIKWLNAIKKRIKTAQLQAALSVNSEMINLYWTIGKSIIEKQEIQKWGTNVVGRLSKDLKREFSEMTGFSRTNLFAMRQFYLFYSQKSEFVPQVVGQIPWGHTRLIINKIKNSDEAFFYSEQTLENGWSRNIFRPCLCPHRQASFCLWGHKQRREMILKLNNWKQKL